MRRQDLARASHTADAGCGGRRHRHRGRALSRPALGSRLLSERAARHAHRQDGAVLRRSVEGQIGRDQCDLYAMQGSLSARDGEARRRCSGSSPIEWGRTSSFTRSASTRSSIRRRCSAIRGEVPRRPGLGVPHRQTRGHHGDSKEARVVFANRCGEPGWSSAEPGDRQRARRPVDAELGGRQPALSRGRRSAIS